MNSRVLAEIALKVWGVILLVGTLRAAPTTLLLAWSSTSDLTAILGLPLNFIVSVFLAGGLIMWGGAVARRIIPESAPLHLDIDYLQLQVLGFALVGLVTLVSGLEGVAAILSRVASNWGVGNGFSYVWTHQPDALIRPLVECAIGITLLVGRRAIARVWWQLRGQNASRDTG